MCCVYTDMVYQWLSAKIDLKLNSGRAAQAVASGKLQGASVAVFHSWMVQRCCSTAVMHLMGLELQ